MSEHERAGAVLDAKDAARVSAFYAGMAGMAVTHTEADHVVLESPSLQLVIVAIPAAVHDPEGNVVQFRVRAD